MRSARSIATATLALCAIGAQGCTRDSRAHEPARGQAPAELPAPRSPLIAHPDYISPALAPSRGAALRNPHEHDARAAATGAALFVSYNCIDCHGAEGSGAMGPSLADGRWHFGGTAGEIYESIAQGRPEGMPAWGNLIADDQIWMLVAYVQSLQAGKDVTTENFTGRTVERTGH